MCRMFARIYKEDQEKWEYSRRKKMTYLSFFLYFFLYKIKTKEKEEMKKKKSDAWTYPEAPSLLGFYRWTISIWNKKIIYLFIVNYCFVLICTDIYWCVEKIFSSKNLYSVYLFSTIYHNGNNKLASSKYDFTKSLTINVHN